jgi:hypothetical protein
MRAQRCQRPLSAEEQTWLKACPAKWLLVQSDARRTKGHLNPVIHSSDNNLAEAGGMGHHSGQRLNARLNTRKHSNNRLIPSGRDYVL